MKSMIFITIFVSSCFAWADLQCVASRASYDVRIVQEYTSPRLQVSQVRNMIYDLPVYITREQGGAVYQAAEVKNTNDAPAIPSLSVGRSGNHLIGVFSEASYLPVVPYLTLECVSL